MIKKYIEFIKEADEVEEVPTEETPAQGEAQPKETDESDSSKFTEVDMDFEKHYIASTIIQILPESRKPAEVKDVKKVKQESDDVIELIKKLADLHSAGILTDDEFSEKKSELLSKI